MKRGNFDSAVIKLLLMGAGIVLTCIIITVGVVNFRQGRQLANSTAQKLSDFNLELSQSDITMYDGLTVRGSDVVNFYKKYFGDEAPFRLTVETALGTHAYTDGGFLDQMKDGADARYVKPTDRFVGKVMTNANGVITEVIFKEK